MVDRTTKLRWRRRLRHRKRQVGSLSEQAEQQLEVNLIRRLSRLWDVKRFLLSWLLLVAFIMGGLVFQNRALGQYYQNQVPQAGGNYTEGIVGAFTTANPLYATGPVDSAVSRLVFSGLFTYDNNNQLIGDLAKNYQTNDRGNIYTVTLKPNLKWQDGQPLTAEDVVFTYKLIQNPDAKSPLAPSWSGVTVAATNPQTVTFTLPEALASFPTFLTNGIVPQHLLSDASPAQLRSINFNTVSPVGAGPFSWKTIEVVGDTPDSREERVALVPNPTYVNGKPKLGEFIIRAFHSQSRLIASFNKHELNGAAGLSIPPANTVSNGSARAYRFPLTSEVMVFLKTSSGVLADPQVRLALAQGTNKQAVADSVGYPVRVLNSPLLPGQPGYDPTLGNPPFNLAAAKATLDHDGWLVGKGGVRFKAGKPLTFQLVSENTPQYQAVTNQLAQQWAALGVQAQFTLEQSSDLQTSLVFHNYDALLYGISVGSDPDVFAYWDSTQADIRSANRLNFSEYHSAIADASLTAARSRTDPAIRAVKYRPFLQAWSSDEPAVALYQPSFLYLTQQTVYGLEEHPINSPIDRYNNVQNWQIRTTTATKP